MNLKGKPNKTAHFDGAFESIQENKEAGITLIALIVAIILLIILSVIVIRQITGDDSIINSTEIATEDYVIEGYKEQLDQLTQSIILKDNLLGNTTTVTSMAEDMEEESWISSAVPYEETDDIIVTTTDGYVFQVYYNEETGERIIKTIGTDNEDAIPTIIATYDETNAVITANASCSDGIAKIELIYKEAVVQTDTSANGSTSAESSFSVTSTGWYQVKATSTKGKTRYTLVRVSSMVTAPTIAVTSSGEMQNTWYGKDDVPVEVTISTDNNVAVGMYYKLNQDEYTYVSGKSITISITSVGKTAIYAYVVDENGNESGISYYEVKYDNVDPEVNVPTATPDALESGWHNTDVVISLSNMTDANSGVAGYYYWEVEDESSIQNISDSEKNYVSGKDTTLTVASEGKKVIAFQAVDNAGNVSNNDTGDVPYTLTIYKDSIAPEDFTPTISEIVSDGFKISASTLDDTSKTTVVSGIAKYEIYIDGVLKETIEVENEGDIATYTAQGLSSETSYIVYVKAIDNAGNTKESSNMTVTTSAGLTAPVITLSGTQGNNGYYTGDITVTITDSGNHRIVYAVSGAQTVAETTVDGGTATFTITADGTSTITARTVDSSSGTSSSTRTLTVLKDSTAPSNVSIKTLDFNSSTIYVTATGEDAVSGIYSYEFQISSTSSSSGFTTVSTQITEDTSISYTYTGLTYGKTYYLRVYVTDKAGNQTLAYNETSILFDPVTSEYILGTVTLNGRVINEGEFTVSFISSDTGVVYAETTNSGDGVFDAGMFSFDSPGSYTYLVYLNDSGLAGVTYDSTVYTMVFTVTTNDETRALEEEVHYYSGNVEVNEIVFSCSYEASPTSVTLASTVVLSGADLADGQFSFNLCDSDGNIIDVKTNDGTGQITFDEIEYSQEGAYTYTIYMVDDNQSYITYDQTFYSVIVTVTDDLNGNLEAEVYYSTDDGISTPAFECTYSRGEGTTS